MGGSESGQQGLVGWLLGVCNDTVAHTRRDKLLAGSPEPHGVSRRLVESLCVCCADVPARGGVVRRGGCCCCCSGVGVCPHSVLSVRPTLPLPSQSVPSVNANDMLLMLIPSLSLSPHSSLALALTDRECVVFFALQWTVTSAVS